MKEIGSEFWTQYELVDIENTDMEVYLLSGRTALDYIVKDILVDTQAKTAILPSYCCESMVKPFLDNSINVIFYDVDSEGIHYNYNNDAEIVLLLDFFGYEIKENECIAKREKLAGKKIIYDSTHKLNGNFNVERWADYSFCSYRKWFYCNYANVVKRCGPFVNNCELQLNGAYLELRNQAADLKKQFIEKQNINKDEFLLGFSNAEKLLEENYSGWLGLPIMAPNSEIIAKRRENANYLTELMSKNINIRLMRKKIHCKDIPLFVPILVETSDRNALQKYLAKRGIYCPIHWPKTLMQKKHSDLYDRELSLVCDQRYSKSDMERIAMEINNFFNK